MTGHDKVINCSIGLRESQINCVEKFLKQSKRFSGVSNFYQYLTDNYFEGEQNWKSMFKNFMVYLGYPLIMMTIMFYVAKSTDDLSKTLIGEGVLIIELSNLANIFFLIGFGILGVLIFNVGILYIKSRKRR